MHATFCMYHYTVTWLKENIGCRSRSAGVRSIDSVDKIKIYSGSAE